MPAPTTTSPSRSPWRSCWRACARCCAGPPAGPRRSSSSARSRSTRGRCGSRSMTCRCNLSPLEYRCLSYLMHHAGRVVPPTELMEHLYAHDHDRDPNAVEVLVGRLRRKLGVDLIETRRGFGYTRAGACRRHEARARSGCGCSRLARPPSSSPWPWPASACCCCSSGMWSGAWRPSSASHLTPARERPRARRGRHPRGRPSAGRAALPGAPQRALLADAAEHRSRGAVLRSRSLWDATLHLPADPPADRGGAPAHDPRSWRCLAAGGRAPDRPAGEPRRRDVRAAVALDRAEIHAAGRPSPPIWSPSLALLAAVLIAAAWVQVGVGLRPLDAVRRRLAQRPFRPGGPAGRRTFPDEVRPLAAEVDHLLDAQEKAIARARARAADLAHGLKTPLDGPGRRCGGAAGRGGRATRRRDRDRHRRHAPARRARTGAGAGGTRGRQRRPPSRARPVARAGGGRAAADATRAGARLGDRHRRRAERPESTRRTWPRSSAISPRTRRNGRPGFASPAGRTRGRGRHDYAFGRGRWAGRPRGRESRPCWPAAAGWTRPARRRLGLAIVGDLVEAYGGSLALGRSALGGLSSPRSGCPAARPTGRPAAMCSRTRFRPVIIAFTRFSPCARLEKTTPGHVQDDQSPMRRVDEPLVQVLDPLARPRSIGGHHEPGRRDADDHAEQRHDHAPPGGIVPEIAAAPSTGPPGAGSERFPAGGRTKSPNRACRGPTKPHTIRSATRAAMA